VARKIIEERKIKWLSTFLQQKKFFNCGDVLYKHIRKGRLRFINLKKNN
jgi:hypothetical protein